MAFLEASYDNKNWFDLPTPNSENFSPTYTHLEKSFRDARGGFHRDIIRRNLAKVTVGWARLNATEMALLQNIYNQSFIYLKYTDNYGNRVTKKMYAGPLDGKTRYADKKTYLLSVRTDVQMNFIEY